MVHTPFQIKRLNDLSAYSAPDQTLKALVTLVSLTDFSTGWGGGVGGVQNHSKKKLTIFLMVEQETEVPWASCIYSF